MTYRPRHRHGFTLTEILIALALVSFLLVGISRIFAMTSSTISKGQGVSTALRSLKAIQQTMSNDFLGYSATGNIDQSDNQSGIAPLVIPAGTSRGAPFLMIGNYRVPTYLNAAAQGADVEVPVNGDNFAVASRKIRSIDRDGDGAIAGGTSPNSISQNGEAYSVYDYGDRNFRCDTLSFFGRGAFQSQTGSGGILQYDLQSSDSWIWYGHLRVFNGNTAELYTTAGYGSPGAERTPGTALTVNPNNKNNQFADQFILGRVQQLLVEPTDNDGNSATPDTVITPSGTPAYFVARTWTTPTDTGSNTPSPMIYQSPVRAWNGTTNQIVDQTTDLPTGGTTTYTFQCRTDISGTNIEKLRERVAFLQTQASTANTWWDTVFTSYNERFWVNPFPASTDSRGMSRRSQLLAEACSQFIVEFAGDFIGQNATSGAVTSNLPDGTIDFVINNDGVRSIRWYGMPRDVDGDGIIVGNTSGGSAQPAIMRSPDVIPLRDIRGGTPGPNNFEKSVPPAAAFYDRTVAEPGTSPSSGSYFCVWGPAQFDTPASTATVGGIVKNLYDVPQMIRVIVEISDPKGRLAEPVTQEYVFPVKVSE